MKRSVLACVILGLIINSQLSAFADPQPPNVSTQTPDVQIMNVRITGVAEEEEHKDKPGIFANYFRIEVKFDVIPAGAAYSGTIECWRLRSLMGIDELIPDSYEGNILINSQGSKEEHPDSTVTTDARCAMHPYADSNTRYYLKIILDSKSKKSKLFRGIDYPLYLTTKSYQNDKIFDGRTMEDCLANEVEQSQKWTDLSSNWTLEPIVTVQMARYTFRSHKTAINAQGAGVGITFKYYPDSRMIASGGSQTDVKRKDKAGNETEYQKFEGPKDIRRIKPQCRATSFDQTNKLAASFISIGPVVYITKPDTAGSDTQVQVAGIVGFFENLVQIGFGTNVSPNKHLDPFLMLGFAKGFDLPATSNAKSSASN